MSDERLGLYALGLSLMTSAGTAFWGVWRWRAERGDRRLQVERDDRKEAIEDAGRYRTLYLAELDRAVLWEHRCRRIDEIAHGLRHQINNDRMIGDAYARQASQSPHNWPPNPPLPKLEDL